MQLIKKGVSIDGHYIKCVRMCAQVVSGLL